MWFFIGWRSCQLLRNKVIWALFLCVRSRCLVTKQLSLSWSVLSTHSSDLKNIPERLFYFRIVQKIKHKFFFRHEHVVFFIQTGVESIKNLIDDLRIEILIPRLVDKGQAPGDYFSQTSKFHRICCFPKLEYFSDCSFVSPHCLPTVSLSPVVEPEHPPENPRGRVEQGKVLQHQLSLNRVGN